MDRTKYLVIPCTAVATNSSTTQPHDRLLCFREFYYIQMEKYARQALAEGVKSADDLVVTTDSELYRVLNLHYNRNNQLEVPEGFRIAVQVRACSFVRTLTSHRNSARRRIKMS